jgi:hypothetical protein
MTWHENRGCGRFNWFRALAIAAQFSSSLFTRQSDWDQYKCEKVFDTTELHFSATFTVLEGSGSSLFSLFC